MTEAIDQQGHDIEKLRDIISQKINRDISIFELNNLLVRFGLENIEELTNQIDKLKEKSISDKEKEKIINRMNNIPDDTTFTEQDAIEIGRIVNDGIVRRYLEDTRKGD